ncbi:MAG: hypothetical protein ACTHYC_00630 [Sphingobacterium sp.]
MKVWYLFVFVVLITACVSTRSTNRPPEIVGNWEWVSTTGGFAGRTSTPTTTNTTQQMQITADSLFSYRSGELLEAESYRLVQAESSLTQQAGWMMEGAGERVFVERKDSTLVLREDCWDCFTHTYHRIPEG